MIDPQTIPVRGLCVNGDNVGGVRPSARIGDTKGKRNGVEAAPCRSSAGSELVGEVLSGIALGHLGNPLLLTAYAIGGLNFFIFSNQYSFVINS